MTFGSVSEKWRARQNLAFAGQKNDPNFSYKVTLIYKIIDSQNN